MVVINTQRRFDFITDHNTLYYGSRWEAPNGLNRKPFGGLICLQYDVTTHVCIRQVEESWCFFHPISWDPLSTMCNTQCIIWHFKGYCKQQRDVGLHQLVLFSSGDGARVWEVQFSALIQNLFLFFLFVVITVVRILNEQLENQICKLRNLFTLVSVFMIQVKNTYLQSIH